jgi:hypothetical protein
MANLNILTSQDNDQVVASCVILSSNIGRRKSADVKIVKRYNSVSPECRHGMGRYNFTFFHATLAI